MFTCQTIQARKAYSVIWDSNSLSLITKWHSDCLYSFQQKFTTKTILQNAFFKGCLISSLILHQVKFYVKLGYLDQQKSVRFLVKICILFCQPVIHDLNTRLLEPDQISHTQSMVAKRGLTNRATVHIPLWLQLDVVS